jgi:putative transposase
MKRFKSPKQAQQFLAVHEPVDNLFQLQRHQRSATDDRRARDQVFSIWDDIAGINKAA